MPVYQRQGTVPNKRHTVFRQPGGALYHEELFGTEGFSGFSSLLYHTNRPTQVKEILRSYDVTPKIANNKNIKRR